MQMLKRLRIAGWKSIKNQDIEFQPLNVLIGANGAGKSNLISLFRMLNAMVAQTPGLRDFIGRAGGATSLLYYGARRTPILELELTFQTDTGEAHYAARWAYAAGDSLVFVDEQIGFRRQGSPQLSLDSLGAGHTETKLLEAAEQKIDKAVIILNLLRRCRLFHFHDTSETSAIRGSAYVEANRFLFPDGGNVASMLYLYKQNHPVSYRRIVAVMRHMIPAFDDFILEPQQLNPKNILLKWKQQGQEYEFGPHQLSDGSIRLVALATLLSQPINTLPLLVTLDEPELGLHPAALEQLAGMAKSATLNCQLLIATQSPTLLDFFQPDDVIVINNRDGESTFQRLSAKELEDWLSEFSLSEIWQKNVVGGGPF